MFKQSQSSILASTRDSMGKPTRRFPLASTADGIAARPARPTRGPLEPELNLERFFKFSCCRQLAGKKAAVESLTLSPQLEVCNSTAASSEQAVDNTKACQK